MFNWSYPSPGTMFPFHRLPNRTPRARCVISLSCWSGFSQRLQNNAGFAVALSFPIKLNAKTLLLKTQHALAKGHGEIKLVLAMKIPHSWLVLVVLEVAIEAARWKKNPIKSFTQLWTIMTVMVRYVQWCNKGIIVKRVTNGFLIEFKAYFNRRKYVVGAINLTKNS